MKEGQIDVSVVLPCKNERKTIGTCIKKIQAVFKAQGIRGEVIVSDSSKDSSPKIAESLGARVVMPWNKGYGNAYLAGFEAARGKIIVMGDADDTYDFYELPRFLAPLREGKADMVLGSRMKGTIMPDAMPALHRFVGNPVLTLFLNLFFGTRISDSHTGFRAFNSTVLKKLSLKTTGMEFASEMIIKAAKNRLRIIEVPVTYYPRHKDAPSNLSSLNDGWRHLRFMLLYAPNYLFIVPGITAFLLGFFILLALLGGPAELFGLRLDLHPLLIGSLLAILGFQTAMMGIFTKVYGVISRLEEHSRTTKLLFEHFSLEKALLAGICVLFIGAFLGADIFSKWLGGQFIGQGIELRQGFLSLTLVILGMQTIFFAFFIGILEIEKKS